MRQLLAALLLYPSLASAQMMGWWGEEAAGGGGGGLTIDSVATSVNTGATATVTPASIPNGAVVVALYSGYPFADGVPTSSNLTFTERQTADFSGPACTIYTAVAASALTSEAISITATGEVPRLTIAVLTGANTSALSTVGYNRAANANWTLTVNAGTDTGYLLASGTVLTASGGTPGTGTTEMYDGQTDAFNGAWHLRTTNTGTGNLTVSGTFGNANMYRLCGIVIKQAP